MKEISKGDVKILDNIAAKYLGENAEWNFIAFKKGQDTMVATNLIDELSLEHLKTTLMAQVAELVRMTANPKWL